jgi:hypothetical protein
MAPRKKPNGSKRDVTRSQSESSHEPPVRVLLGANAPILGGMLLPRGGHFEFGSAPVCRRECGQPHPIPKNAILPHSSHECGSRQADPRGRAAPAANRPVCPMQRVQHIRSFYLGEGLNCARPSPGRQRLWITTRSRIWYEGVRSWPHSSQNREEESPNRPKPSTSPARGESLQPHSGETNP